MVRRKPPELTLWLLTTIAILNICLNYGLPLTKKSFLSFRNISLSLPYVLETQMHNMPSLSRAESGEVNIIGESKHLEKSKSSMGNDTEIIVASNTTESILYERSEEQDLVRKIDWRIMPFLWGYAVLSAVDKIIISNAALYGMKTDTHLVGQQYSWGKI